MINFFEAFRFITWRFNENTCAVFFDELNYHIDCNYNSIVITEYIFAKPFNSVVFNNDHLPWKIHFNIRPFSTDCETTEFTFTYIPERKSNVLVNEFVKNMTWLTYVQAAEYSLVPRSYEISTICETFEPVIGAFSDGLLLTTNLMVLEENYNNSIDIIAFDTCDKYLLIFEQLLPTFSEGYSITRYCSSIENNLFWYKSTFFSWLSVEERLSTMQEHAFKAIYLSIIEAINSTAGMLKEWLLQNIETVFSSTTNDLIRFFTHCLIEEELQNSFGGTRIDWYILEKEVCQLPVVWYEVKYLISKEELNKAFEQVEFGSYLVTYEDIT